MNTTTNPYITFGDIGHGDHVGMRWDDLGLVLAHGPAGTGKTNWLRNLFGQLAHCDDLDIVVINGQVDDAAAAGDYAPLAPRLSALVGNDPDAGATLLDQIVAEISRRRRMGPEETDPAGHRPILLVIDECDHLPQAGLDHQLTAISKLGRSVGVAAVVTTNAIHQAVRWIRSYDAAVALLRFDRYNTDGDHPKRHGALIAADPLTDPEGKPYDSPQTGPATQPLVTLDEAAAVATDTAAHRRPIPGVTIGTEHLS